MYWFLRSLEIRYNKVLLYVPGSHQQWTQKVVYIALKVTERPLRVGLSTVLLAETSWFCSFLGNLCFTIAFAGGSLMK